MPPYLWQPIFIVQISNVFFSIECQFYTLKFALSNLAISAINAKKVWKSGAETIIESNVFGQ